MKLLFLVPVSSDKLVKAIETGMILSIVEKVPDLTTVLLGLWIDENISYVPKSEIFVYHIVVSRCRARLVTPNINNLIYVNL